MTSKHNGEAICPKIGPRASNSVEGRFHAKPKRVTSPKISAMERRWTDGHRQIQSPIVLFSGSVFESMAESLADSE
jgi:hypothetical protein